MSTPSDEDCPGGADPTGPQPSTEPSPGVKYRIPLGLAAPSRLLFASGAVGVTLKAEPALPDLCRARFAPPIPSFHLQDATVTVRYPSIVHGQDDDRRRPLAQIALNTSIAWDLEFRGDVCLLNADLRHLSLRALDLAGLSRARITLPRPIGAAYIYIAGRASSVTFKVPSGVAVRLRIDNRASDITLGAQKWTAGTDGIFTQTPGYHRASDRYDVSIAGSASNVHFTIG